MLIYYSLHAMHTDLPRYERLTDVTIATRRVGIVAFLNIVIGNRCPFWYIRTLSYCPSLSDSINLLP